MTDSSERRIVLRAVHLHKHFGGVRAVDDVSLDLQAGEACGLVGPNGSGKTTLLNCLAGFTSCSGQVLLGDRDVSRTQAFLRARMGVVKTFQEEMIFPGKTLGENLLIALSASGRPLSKRPASVEHLLDYFDLRRIASRPAKTMSWGEKRLAGIAIAVAVRPSILLLDEPFAGLSPVATVAVGSILSKLCRDGVALLVVDHNLSPLFALCQRVMVMHLGMIIADGPPEQVRSDEAVRAAYLGGQPAADRDRISREAAT